MVDVLVVVLAHEINHFRIQQRLHVQGNGPRFGKYLGIVDGDVHVEASEAGAADESSVETETGTAVELVLFAASRSTLACDVVVCA